MRFRFAFLAISLIKICIVMYFSFFPTTFFGGGNDSTFYDAYAQGEDSQIPNVWPVVLRKLNDLGMYSRSGVSYVLALLGVCVVPLLAARLAVIRFQFFQAPTFWFVAFVIATYPTLFFYTFDIYRDVLMVFLFLLGLFAVRSFINSASALTTIYSMCIVMCISYALFLLRPYLGFGFLMAFLGFRIFKFNTVPLTIYLACFLAALNSAFALSFLDPLFIYRGIFDDMDGGTNIGIRFESNHLFVFDFLKSATYQIFGFYFPNFPSILVFIAESVPFMISLGYLIKNRRYANPFVSYLFTFSLVYSTIWILGNDNLGTAVRLRMYAYISIFIAAVIISQRKRGCDHGDHKFGVYR